MVINNTIQSLQEIDFTLGHVIILNKDKTWTSFDAVNKIRYMIRNKFSIRKLKVGHGGTLDPLATGVMVIGVGKETKNLATYQNEQKEYIAEITFGGTTPSYDLETSIDQTFETAHISSQLIEEVLSTKLNGTIDQMPPIYSAKSVDGVRAYEAARKGISIDIKPQQVTIYNTKLHSYHDCKATISIACSKGTYIRSIAYDLGKELNSGAFLSSLERTKSGGFHIEESLTIKDFETLLEKVQL